MKHTARLAAFVLCLAASARADLDLDSNGLGDVWEAKYKPATLVASVDSDADGRTNLEECEAGTDPLSAEDIFSVSDIQVAGNNLLITWPSQTGKRYQIQSTTTPGTAASWLAIPGIHSGTGQDLDATTPQPAAAKAFFRVVAADVDTDSDGLTDWEEIQAGYDPAVNNQTGGSDLQRLTAALESDPVISISAVDEDATEPPANPNGAAVADNASFRIRRQGGISRVVVNLSTGGTASVSDFAAIPATVAVPLAAQEILVSVNALPDLLTESDESVIITLAPAATYDLGGSTKATVLIHDRVLANGIGLAGNYWKHPANAVAPLYTDNLPYLPAAVAPTLSRIDSTINFNSTVAAWPGSPITVGTTSNYFSSRWTGEIAPEFSQSYTIFVDANESSRLMINGQVLMNRWPAKPVPANPNAIWDEWPNRIANAQNEFSAIISLEAGKRYPIVLEHYQNSGGHKAVLSWQSQSQIKQVIPATRLFPNTPPRILGPYEALAFVGDVGGFQYQINASANPTSYSASNLPPGLELSEGGLISGSPAEAGEWRVLMTATNDFGSGSAFLDITVISTSGGITRELWTGIPGTSVSQIPLTTAPNSTSLLTSLQAPVDAANDYGARIRGFVTAPASGDYRFFLRADESAEFYLSDDEEPVNAWKRAEVTSPVSAADWTGAVQSPLLRLEAGKRYYLEIRHKEGSGRDHLALGWRRPDVSETADPVVIPGHFLTRFEDLPLGTATFTPPPAPPSWTSETDAANTASKGAARILQQATFGASGSDIAALQSAASFDSWIEDQFLKPATLHLPYVRQQQVLNDPIDLGLTGDFSFNSWWKNSITADDQLRQRVAFALSEIMVVSENGPLDERADAVSDYYDTLLQHSFGNARDLLEAVTLHPAMGKYLDMLRNQKPDLTSGRIPNENYAREILQLFSLGLYRMHPDGSLILNSKGETIPVYGQEEIIGFAHVFTGWDYHYTGALTTGFSATANWVDPMREAPARHFTGRKRILNNVVLPGISTLNGAPLDPYGSHNGAAISGNAEFQALARLELDAVHDQIFQHPNFGPFLCRQLIQRLVTSTPSRGYIYRVVSKFNDNGSGVRGDMQAVIKAILLDYEARSLVAANAPGYGKQREPVIRVTQFARAFRPPGNITGAYTQDGGLITINTSPAPHRLASGQAVQLAFSGPSAASTDGSYSLTSAVPVTEFTFGVRAKDVFRCNWTQAANVITVTTSGAHNLTAGKSVYLRFRTGAAGVLVDGVYPLITASGSTFTVAAPDSAIRTGNTLDAAWILGDYKQTVTGGVTTLRIYCDTVPALAEGDKLSVSFTPDAGETPPPNGTYTVGPVVATQPPSFTLKPDSGVQSLLNGIEGSFQAAALTPVLNRGGLPEDIATTGFSSWDIDSTTTDLGQTPLRANTVFNFFEPDYQFPGTLAANNLITPEFQISSDTNVLRQANFMFGGIFSSATATNAGPTNGFNTFRRGEGDITVDFSPWMRPITTGGTDYWTNTANLRLLIQEFSRILMAGQMSEALEDQIYDFVINTTNVAYGTTPTETNRRDRVRAILHLIAVSPELAIQR
ncbi:DUF1800 family protein [Luteolibacter sp. Populi]|uniref:DUF1800 family protein n=1 Tax=Luteolibacter sp. Populi TaxID=3230487 RepID=UPI0034670EB7